MSHSPDWWIDTVRFSANLVAVDDTDELLLVAFAEELDGTCRDVLHFQRSIDFDEQDRPLGMDQVYIERGIQSGSAYGGILSMGLSPRQARVVVNDRTAAAL